MKIYPIKFYPILKEKIWGGNKLADEITTGTRIEIHYIKRLEIYLAFYIFPINA